MHSGQLPPLPVQPGRVADTSRHVPRHGELDFIGHGQYPLQVLRAKGARLPEGDPGGQPLYNHRPWIALDPLVWHLHGVFNPQGLTWERRER